MNESIHTTSHSDGRIVPSMIRVIVATLTLLSAPLVPALVTAPAEAASCYHKSGQAITPEEYDQLEPGVTTFPQARAITGSAGFAMDPAHYNQYGFMERSWRVCARSGWVMMHFDRHAGAWTLTWKSVQWS